MKKWKLAALLHSNFAFKNTNGLVCQFVCWIINSRIVCTMRSHTLLIPWLFLTCLGFFLFHLINTLWLEHAHTYISKQYGLSVLHNVHIYIFFYYLIFFSHFFGTSKAENMRKSLGCFRHVELWCSYGWYRLDLSWSHSFLSLSSVHKTRVTLMKIIKSSKQGQCGLFTQGTITWV